MSSPQTTIEDLPREILHKIFSAFVGPRMGGASDCSRRRRPVLLSHTCQAWRAQTIATPSLWTDVLILGTSKLYFSFFHRSSPLLVNLTISFPNTIPLEGDSSVGAMIARFLTRSFGQEPELVSRIRSFHLIVQGENQAYSTLDSFDFRKFVNLSSFQVGTQHGLPLGSIYLPQAPNIQEAKLVGFLPQSASFPRTVTKLTIGPGSTGGVLDANAFRRIIEGLPKLETLILEINFQVHGPRGPTQRFPPLHAPSLKHLAIASVTVVPHHPFSFSGPEPTCAQHRACALGTLTADRLEYIEVGGPDWSVLHHFTNLINSQANRVTTRPLTLLLQQVHSPVCRDLDLFDSLPSNIHLCVVPPPGAECAECLDFYTAKAGCFSTIGVRSAHGHRVEEYDSHVFIPPRRALETLIPHSTDRVLGYPASDVHILRDPAMPYLSLKPTAGGRKNKLKGARFLSSKEATPQCHHRSRTSHENGTRSEVLFDNWFGGAIPETGSSAMLVDNDTPPLPDIDSAQRLRQVRPGLMFKLFSACPSDASGSVQYYATDSATVMYRLPGTGPSLR